MSPDPPGRDGTELPRRTARLLWALVALGGLLRGAVWLQQRSVYLDEVNLLRNFLERPYAGLFRGLDYEQYSPPLFSVLMKAAVAAFGTGELAIRAVPLLSSLGALVLFRHLAGRWLPPLAAGLALGFVAFGGVFLDFGTACKQYSTDGLVALALLALADRQGRRPAFGPGAAAGWAAGGAAAVWLSMPAVFVLAGVGCCFAYVYRAEWRRATGGRLLAVGVSWGASFLVYFLLLLRNDAQSDYIQAFHRDAFLAFPPRSAADLRLLGQQLGGLVDKAFGKTVLAAVLAALGLGLSGPVLVRRRPALAWLLLTPWAACLGASALHYYSLVARLMLFLLPVGLLLLFLGLAPLLARRWLGPVLGLAVVLTLLNQQRLKHFVVPFRADYADARAGLAYVARQQRPGDTLFVYHNLAPVAYYYRVLHPRPLPLRPVLVEPPPPPGTAEAVLRDLDALAAAGQRRLWLVYDRPDPLLLDWAARRGAVRQRLDFYRGYAFLYEAR